MSSPRDYDIIIVGAGMVGATLACALLECVRTERGLRIALVEANMPERSWEPGSTDLRVSAITPVTERILARLGAWETIAGLGVSPFREMRVWDAAGAGSIHFDSVRVASPVLGHIIENRVVQRALLELLDADESVDLICPSRIEGLSLTENEASLALDDGRVLTASLVVAADGGRSKVRELAGISLHGWSYGHKAVVASVRPELDHAETAWQRFLPDGPLAFLPLRDGQCSIVWSTGPEHADHLLESEEEDFCTELAEAFDHRLGRILETGPRAAFPLRLRHATQYVSGRLALIGDAAHTIHPLAGQGANLGILDAVTLAEILGDVHARGLDIADTRALRRYERWRRAENTRMIAAMEGFKRLFGTRNPLLSAVRNVGLDITDRCSPAKDLILQYHLGRYGHLPELARP
ncbi:MAG: 2-octaprenyl-3-methyl-6-methoxy-1,4-benzoquinol hydroxylase [Gammaproteobacteria bacterium]|nr:2-octaprenyl-3-methyl-6-methoxy-1,4-benzoquinol hydroxylase [Gammaproteobacteria bacterium]